MLAAALEHEEAIRMIRIEGMSNTWGQTFTLDDISLEVREGEYFVILGPTGAGKTLLLEIIAGIHYPEEGRILIGGEDKTLLPPERRNIGFMYQDYSLFPHMDAKSNIEYGMRVRGIDAAQRERRLEELIGLLDISPLLHRDVTTLSGGEQQKVAMARALACYPKVLLLDEPFSALDERTKSRLIHEMKALHRHERLTVVHVTHSQEEALQLADRIAIMMDGRIVQVGTPSEIFSRPSSMDIADFVKVENIWKAHVKECTPDTLVLDLYGFEVRMARPEEFDCSEREVRLLIRPEDIVVGSGAMTSARNRFHGTITAVEQRGFYHVVRMDCGFPVVTVVTKQSVEELGLKAGASVDIFFKTTALHVVSVR
jgi:molybdate/tungstate transport system ATP-binding protein